MNIPRYWVKSTEDVTLDDGRLINLTAWGWSSINKEEARQKSEERLANLLDRVRRREDLPKNHYLYGNRPLREEIIEEIRTIDHEAIITRNSYGSLVLNTSHVLFVDIDLPVTEEGGGMLKKLFGKKPADPAMERLPALRESLMRTGGSFRFYRTAAGFRILGTDPMHVPDAAETEDLMKSLGADPSFVHLCRIQKSFRARLTPKPWRCGIHIPPGSFPREEIREQTEFEQWLSSYERNCASHATCRFIEEIGRGRVQPEAAEIVRIHDSKTRISEPLPLA